MLFVFLLLLMLVNKDYQKNLVKCKKSLFAHRARQTVEHLRRETPELISSDMWHNVASQQLNPPGGLPHLGRDAGASVQDSNPRHGRVVTAAG